MKKQLGINLISQVVAFIVNIGISFFLTPYIVENIGVEANGFVNLANNFIQFAQLFTVALNSMAGRFITVKIHSKGEKEGIKYYSSVFIANVVLSIFLTIVFIFVLVFLQNIIKIPTDLLMDVKLLWAFIFLNFIIGIFTSIFNTSTFIKDRLDLSALVNIKSYILRVVVLIICFCFFKSTVIYVGLATFISGLYLLVANIKLKNKLTPELKANKKEFDISAIRELLISGIWNSVSKLSTILSTGLDLLLSNIFITSEAMGILSLSKTIPTVILSLFGTMGAIFAPQLTVSYAKKDIKSMENQLLISIKILGLCASIPMTILIVLGANLYGLWTPSQDANLLQLLSIVSCASLIFCLPLEPLYNIFTVTNKPKAPALFILGCSIVNIVTVLIGVNLVENDISKLLIIAGVSTVTGIIRVLTFLPIYSAKCLNFKNTFLSIYYKKCIISCNIINYCIYNKIDI